MTGDSQWDQVAALLGEAAAGALTEALGGARLYIPKRPPGVNHPLSVALGAAAAGVLAQSFGGEHVDVPLSEGRHARILRLRKAGKTIREIRLSTGISRRLIYLVLARAKGDPPPSELSPQPRLL